MKKFALFYFSFMLTFANCFAGQIHSYDELASAMQSGSHIVFIVNFQECTGNFAMPITYFAPSKMMLIPASKTNSERIVTSDLHFTDFTGLPTYEYVKYTFNADNSVQISFTVYDPLTFKPLDIQHIINCAFGEGISIHTTDP